jgi:hypothetical protein
MSLPITEVTKGLLENQVKQPQLILEIDGLPLFGSSYVGIYPRYGDEIFYGDDGLYYGELFIDKNTYPYIDLDNSTNSVTQQLLIDKGGSSSATTFDITLIDKNQFISNLISPGFVLDDVLGRKAKVYLALEGGGHPRDSILFFNGIVSGIKSGAGNVKINLASPEKLKNLEIFPKVNTVAIGAINNSQTTINVETTSDFVLAADSGTLRAFIQIDDEIIEYTGKSSTSFTGCIRGSRGTIATNHDSDANVEIRYLLTGSLKDLSLKLMLSGINEDYVSDIEIVGINTNGALNVANAVFVAREDFQRYYGVVTGDIATISGDAIISNNGAYTILDIVSTDSGSYLLLNGSLTSSGTGGALSVKSKYAVLPKFCGLEMTPDQVDVEEFELKDLQFSTQFFEYSFFIDDQVNGAEFINTQILFPSGCYSLPRKAKTSIGLTIPPLAGYDIKKISEKNVTNASRLQIDRNISKNFYNAIVLKFDKKDNDSKYLRGRITQSADSTNRIKIANKPMVITSDGVRAEAEFEAKFLTLNRRLLERYQYGAESIEVETNLGTGFEIEIGDTVIFEGKELQVTDSTQGNRNFLPRLFEVQNKVISLKGNAVKFQLVDTAYNLNGRYAVISPSSEVDTGSTTTVLRLKKSYGTNLTTSSEQYKWRNLIGSTLRIRNEDYSFDENSRLIGLDPANENGIILETPLSSIPLEGYFVDITEYPQDTEPEIEAILKASYCYWNNQATVLAGISQTQFTVDNVWLPDIKVGYLVKIHDDDYNYLSVEAEVTDVTGNTVTVDTALGFTPSLNDKIELLGFPDGGAAYRFL